LPAGGPAELIRKATASTDCAAQRVAGAIIVGHDPWAGIKILTVWSFYYKSFWWLLKGGSKAILSPPRTVLRGLPASGTGMQETDDLIKTTESELGGTVRQ
jgi:hypothetical protein